MHPPTPCLPRLRLCWLFFWSWFQLRALALRHYRKASGALTSTSGTAATAAIDWHIEVASLHRTWAKLVAAGSAVPPPTAYAASCLALLALLDVRTKLDRATTSGPGLPELVERVCAAVLDMRAHAPTARAATVETFATAAVRTRPSAAEREPSAIARWLVDIHTAGVRDGHLQPGADYLAAA